MMQTIHATALSWDGHGVLLVGPSGSGKSDLALRLLALSHPIETGPLFKLIADDRVIVTDEDTSGGLKLTPPAALRGKLEVRGVGIITLPANQLAQTAIARLVVRLVPDADRQLIERLPDPSQSYDLAVFSLPRIDLVASDASAPHKVRQALALAKGAKPPVRD